MITIFYVLLVAVIERLEQNRRDVMISEKLLSVLEAEAMTGRKASTWRRDIHERRVGVVKLGRLVRIPLSEVQRLVSSGYRPPADRPGIVVSKGGAQ